VQSHLGQSSPVGGQVGLPLVIACKCYIYTVVLCSSMDWVVSLHGLHFACNVIDLFSFKFLWWAPQDFPISASGTFQPFKVIQGH